MPININPPEKEFALNLEAQFAESLRLIVINCQEKCRPQAKSASQKGHLSPVTNPAKPIVKIVMK